MKLLEELQNVEVDVQEALERIMGDTELYEMMLGMFVDMVKQTPVNLADFDAADLEGITKQVHTLKGTTGNLSIKPLFDGYNQILSLLRENKPAQAKELMLKLLPEQDKIVAVIEKYR